MTYIPEKHKQYNLLPNSAKYGGEVFSYLSVLVDEVGSYFPKGTDFIPYGYDSYEEYYEYLEKYKSEAKDQHCIIDYRYKAYYLALYDDD